MIKKFYMIFKLPIGSKGYVEGNNTPLEFMVKMKGVINENEKSVMRFLKCTEVCSTYPLDIDISENGRYINIKAKNHQKYFDSLSIINLHDVNFMYFKSLENSYDGIKTALTIKILDCKEFSEDLAKLCFEVSQ